MSVDLTYSSLLTAKETLSVNVPAADVKKRVVTHDLYNTVSTLNSGTVPPATDMAAFEKALVAGAVTIDLTALTGTNGRVVDGTGLRVQALKFRNKSVNAATLKLKKGGTNGYDGFGALFSITLAPKAEVMILNEDAGGDISSTNKTLDLTGTDVEVGEFEIILG